MCWCTDFTDCIYVTATGDTDVVTKLETIQYGIFTDYIVSTKYDVLIGETRQKSLLKIQMV